MHTQKYCICVISHKPSLNWLVFLQKQKQYDTFLVIDDNQFYYADQYKHLFPNVNIIQINELHCVQAGFSELNYLIRKKLTGWDKAVYYFACLNRNYEHVWFIEDDVFLYSEETLINIDNQFPLQDFLSAGYVSREQSLSWYHWPRIKIDFSYPHYMSMVCAIRLSKLLLAAIKAYAKERKHLFFLEAFFPTITWHANLKYANPKELSTILYRQDWKMEEINKTYLFHPLKDFNLHTLYREYLSIFE